MLEKEKDHGPAVRHGPGQKRSQTRSHRMKFCVQRGLGALPQQASGEENHGGIFFSAGLCVLTQALLASIIPNQNNFGITTVLAIPHDGGGGRTEELKARDPNAIGGVDEHAEGAGGGNNFSRVDFRMRF